MIMHFPFSAHGLFFLSTAWISGSFFSFSSMNSRMLKIKNCKKILSDMSMNFMPKKINNWRGELRDGRKKKLLQFTWYLSDWWENSHILQAIKKGCCGGAKYILWHRILNKIVHLLTFSNLKFVLVFMFFRNDDNKIWNTN